MTVAALTVAPPTRADDRLDRAYLGELSRMGFAGGDDHGVFVAKQTCEEMDKAKTDKRWPLMAGLNETFVNMAGPLWTVTDIFAVTGAAIRTYCPQYSKDFYAEVGQWRIKLP